MTPQEVIKTLEVAKAEVEWNYPMDYATAIDEAIKAVDKQIPKKDKNDSCRCKKCGTNNNFIINKLANPKGHPIIHCWNCGQAIDWEVEE